MRKYINMMAVYVILLSLTGISCKKSFLEIVPKGSFIARTYEDYNLLMNGSTFYTFKGQGIWLPAALMGDDVSAEGTDINTTGLEQSTALFQWNADLFLPSPYAFSDNPWFLNTLLTDMYTLNKIVTEVKDAPGGTEQQKLQVQSEARVARAFAHFQLINYFAKPYNAATASSDPGFPIITVPDVTSTSFKRGTVQEMYDFITTELTASIPNLNIQPSYPTRWSKPGAEAFLGKLYLFMGKNTEALQMFNMALADISKWSTPPRLYDYNVELAPGGKFLPKDPVYGPATPFSGITDITESVVALMSNGGNYSGNNYGVNFLTLSPATQALFKPSDLRLNLYTNSKINNTPIPGGRLRRYIPSSFYTRIGVELSELYLLSAEAKARTNDLQGAKVDLEMLRKKRMPANDAIVPQVVVDDKTALIRYIIDERIREFAGLGYRWFDMRRLSTDPIFSGQPPSVHIIHLDGGGTTEIALKPERLTLRIPPLYLRSHPEMVDNP